MKQSKHVLIAAITSMLVITFYTANSYIEHRFDAKEHKIEFKEEKELTTICSMFNLEEVTEMSFADSVKTLIEQLNIKHPDIVFQQATIETGNFTSDIFKENNNLFGMHCANKRPNLQTGVNRGYATYESWQHSVYDFAIWQAYCIKGMSREQYIEYLRTTYATDSTYIDKLKIK